MLSEGEINKTEQCVLLVRSRLSIKRESSRGSNEPFPLAMKHDEEDQDVVPGTMRYLLLPAKSTVPW